MLAWVLWTSLGLVGWTHAGYPALLWLLARRPGEPPPPPAVPEGELPRASLIVAAFDEEDVIARKVENALAQDYPPHRLEVTVASDGSRDRTVERARAAGAHQVLDLPRGGKIRAQDAAVERASGDVLAFSDANSLWAPDALRRLVEPLADPGVGYVCGQVRFVRDGGSSEEGAYWRYEMAVRELESRLAGVTAGNGAIYAVAREAYLRVDPRMGHDLSFPFNVTRRGRRAVYQPSALAREKMVPTSEGEFRRKRRMMSHAWPIILRGGLLDPRGLPPLYVVEIVSHRLLRYLTPFLHLVALAANLPLVARGRTPRLLLAGQAAVLAAAALAPRAPLRPLRLARHYVLTTAAIAFGLWDYARTGTPAEWDTPEGTR